MFKKGRIGAWKKQMNEDNQWVKDMKRRGQKELSKQGDEQNKFIHYNNLTLIHKSIANSVNKIIVCVCN